MSEQAKAKVRAQRALKHYKNNLLTQAGNPDKQTVVDLLSDLIDAGWDVPNLLALARLAAATSDFV
jgi:hypothetical protein